MIALEELYGEANDSERLLEILKLRVENAESDGEKTKQAQRYADLIRLYERQRGEGAPERDGAAAPRATARAWRCRPSRVSLSP